MGDRKIEKIPFGRAIQTKLGMYLSSDKEEALELGLREIYVNSFDAITEAKQSSGKVKITINTDERKVSVEDNGPGIKSKLMADGVTNSIVSAYTEPHSGSHFGEQKDLNSIGSHGIGAKAVTHTSKLLLITSINDNTRTIISFWGTPDGAVLDSFEETPFTSNKTGVKTIYYPKTEVYGDNWFNKTKLIKTLDEMLKFYPKIKLEIDFDGDIRNIHYPNGLKDKNSIMYYESNNLIMNLKIRNKNEPTIKAYGNRLFLPQGGKFLSHFKTQLTRTINSQSEYKLSGPQIFNLFSGELAIFVNNPLFSNQAKTSLSNTEVNTEITLALKQEFEKFVKTSEWQKLLKNLEAEQKAEEAAERARQRVKDSLNKIKKGGSRAKLSEKLKDCINTGKGTWLAITEGDSASGALVHGRDVENVALMPIRGKLINCLKNPQEKYLANEEVQQIAQILGCGIFENYNPKKLKYEKVLIAVDADSDGLNIATLLMTYFYTVIPDLIKEGRLYWMQAPLYANQSKSQYIFTEKDWSKVKSKKGFSRLKGLGEMSPKMVEEAMFGEHKRWIQLKPRNWNNFASKIESLMGSEVENRKQLLFEKVNFEKIKFL